MSVENPNPNGEFYKPLCGTRETVRKIEGLLRQSPATIFDLQLFESIADVREATANKLVNAGTMGIYGPLTVTDLRNIDFQTGEGVIGIGYGEEKDRQLVYIDFSPDYTVFFYRDRNGEITPTRSSDDLDDYADEHPSSPDAAERKTIVETLMTCMRQPLQRIS